MCSDLKFCACVISYYFGAITKQTAYLNAQGLENSLALVVGVAARVRCASVIGRHHQWQPAGHNGPAPRRQGRHVIAHYNNLLRRVRVRPACLHDMNMHIQLSPDGVSR